MFYEVQVIQKRTRAKTTLCGWWRSDRHMFRGLKDRGFLVVAWTKR